MIATGRQVFNDKSSKSVEIFDMVTENLRTCTKVQSFPFESLEDASGGIVDGSPIICGGYTGKGSTRYDRITCHSFRDTTYYISQCTRVQKVGIFVTVHKPAHILGCKKWEFS